MIGGYFDGHPWNQKVGIKVEKRDHPLCQMFDAERLEVTGGSFPLIEGVAQHLGSGVAQFSTSDTGSLVYVPGASGGLSRTLVWVNREGQEEPLADEARAFEYPRLSPDGRRIAVGIREANSDIWVYDVERGTLTRLTVDPGEDESPVWTPDGQKITYAATHGGARLTLQRLSDGSGEEEAVPVGEYRHHHLGAWSPDGQTLAFSSNGLWLAPVGKDAEAEAFLQTDAIEQAPAFSPDGRWLAYASTETGRSEIYVQAFPGGGSKRQISNDGGAEPLWSADGEELFYRAGNRMMVVMLEDTPSFSASRPRVLFEDRFERLPWNERNYDVSPDGERFLMPWSRQSAGSQPLLETWPIGTTLRCELSASRRRLRLPSGHVNRCARRSIWRPCLFHRSGWSRGSSGKSSSWPNEIQTPASRCGTRSTSSIWPGSGFSGWLGSESGGSRTLRLARTSRTSVTSRSSGSRMRRRSGSSVWRRSKASRQPR